MAWSSFQLSSPLATPSGPPSQFGLDLKADVPQALPQGGEFQLTPPTDVSSTPPSMGMDWGGIAGAGTQAAATAATLASQAAQQQAQRDFGAAQSSADRAQQAKLAKMRLAESGRAFDQANQGNAYQSMISAFANSAGTAGAAHDVQRNASSSMDQLLASAMLRR